MIHLECRLILLEARREHVSDQSQRIARPIGRRAEYSPARWSRNHEVPSSGVAKIEDPHSQGVDLLWTGETKTRICLTKRVEQRLRSALARNQVQGVRQVRQALSGGDEGGLGVGALIAAEK